MHKVEETITSIITIINIEYNNNNNNKNRSQSMEMNPNHNLHISPKIKCIICKDKRNVRIVKLQ